jgi:NAD(P)-dependent dehydrogenase (short-subunit alcohol dehydrogenase family)
MGSRNRDRGEKAVADLRALGLPVEFVHIDVTVQSSVDQAATEVERRHGRPDILVNNAAIAIDWIPGSELTAEAMAQTFDTNVFGVLRNERHASAVKKIQARSDREHVECPGGRHPYIRSKQSVCLAEHTGRLFRFKSRGQQMTVQLANELGTAGITVNAATPGFTATDMNQHRGTRTVEEAAATPVRLALLADDGPTAGVFSDAGAEPW